MHVTINLSEINVQLSQITKKINEFDRHKSEHIAKSEISELRRRVSVLEGRP